MAVVSNVALVHKETIRRWHFFSLNMDLATKRSARLLKGSWSFYKLFHLQKDFLPRNSSDRLHGRMFVAFKESSLRRHCGSFKIKIGIVSDSSDKFGRDSSYC